MAEVENFLSAQEEQEIVEAIQKAEKETSGEIRVHIETKAQKDEYKRALEVFHQLEMHKTKQRNGVLIYVAIRDKKFVICGDEGIHKAVPENFWDTTKNTMQQHFKQGNFKAGITAGILSAGEKLKTYFPHTLDDVDELPNEISKT